MNREIINKGLWIAGLALLTACGNTGNDSGDAVGEESEVVVDGHHAANALDYFGTYVGVLPCENCEDLQVEVVINTDSTFRFTTFNEEGDTVPHVVTAGWSIDRNTITFDKIEQRFHVAENRLIPIGDDGSRYTGEREERFSLMKLD